MKTNSVYLDDFLMPCDSLHSKYVAVIKENPHFDSTTKMYHYEIVSINPFVDVKILKTREKIC